MEILTPKSQLYLFGYDKIFNSFIALYKKNKLPNVMLFSGPKGSGKSTFTYHFINYLLSSEFHSANEETVSDKTTFNNSTFSGNKEIIELAKSVTKFSEVG